jgi:sec-independent protein translocase protein TatB
MFDIGFTEILVIGVVALIVIGPDRLPGVARTLGHLFGRMQRYVNDVKADIQREMDLDELKKMRKDVEDSARAIEDSARSFEQSVSQEVHAAQDAVRDLEASARSLADIPRLEPAAVSSPDASVTPPAQAEQAPATRGSS